MNRQSIEKVPSSGPKDQSLNAFKAWILEIAGRLTTNQNGVNFTEAEWLKYWQEFWAEKFKK